jgi:serine/threonine protein phosphatase PrpC
MLSFETCAISEPGGREGNEDSFGYFHHAASGEGAWVAADGLGGHSSGEVASRLATESIIGQALKLRDFSDESLSAMALAANRLLLAKQAEDPKLKGMGTTLAAVFAKGQLLRVLHAGDTRFYFFSGGKLKFCTKDHSIARRAADAGEISFHAIRFHKDRNVVTKVIGQSNLRFNEPHDTIAAKPGDAFLICTDGFWEYVYEHEMEEDLRQSSSPRDWAARMRGRIGSRAPDGHDNLTAVCAWVREG